MLNPLRYFWLILVSFFLFWAFSYAVDKVKDYFDSAPITIESGFTETPVLKPGEPLRIALVVTRNRTCHTAVARYVHSANGDVVAYQELIGGDAPIGTSRYAFSFALPAGIKPGKYTFKGVVSSSCGERRHVETTRAIPFSVSP